MPDRETLSLRENCNMKKWKTYRNMTYKFRSSAIHSNWYTLLALFQLTVPPCCLIKVSQARQGIVIVYKS
jgi:hypothetical protein